MYVGWSGGACILLAHKRTHFSFYNVLLCRLQPTRRDEDNFQESVISFFYVGTGDHIHVIRFGGKCQYLWSHLTGPGA